MKSIRIVVTIALLQITAVSSAQPRQISLTELLDKFENTQQVFSRIRAKSETLTEATNSKTGNIPLWFKEITDFRYDGQRYDIIRSSWFDLESSDALTPAQTAQNSREFWDGEMDVGHWFFRENDMKDIITTIVMSREKNHHTAHAYIPGAPMAGIFSGDLKPVAIILREADRIRLRDNMEMVGGFLCHVIEAKSKNGKYTIWVDPEHGYNISRASVNKAVGDIAFGQRMGPKDPPILIPGTTETRNEIINYSFGLDNVRYEEINGFWVPMEADFDVMIEYQDHQILKEIRHHKRTLVDLEPDFEAIGAFVADFPDGVLIVFPEFPGIRYMWQDGQAVPRIDKFTVDSIEYVIEQAQSDVQVNFTSLASDRQDESVQKSQPISGPKTVTSKARRPKPLLGIFSSPVVLLVAGGSLIIISLIWRISHLLKPKTKHGT